MSVVRLIMFSAFNLAEYLPIARQALGHGVSAKADAGAASDMAHNMMCVAGLIDGEATDVDHLYYAAYLVACDQRDLYDVLSLSAMSQISVESKRRGIRAAILSGSLPEWKAAIQRGCSKGCESEVRKVYNQIYKDLTTHGLGCILGMATERPQTDDTFLLEFKP